MSIRTTKPFLEAHAALRDQVGQFLVTAHKLPDLQEEDRIELIEQTATFLAEILLPHAAAEERVLYPEAARLLGDADESDCVAGDRAAVRELLGRLAVCDARDAGAVQEVLYALYTLLSSHLWREEAVYLRLVGGAADADVNTVLRAVTNGGRRGRRVRPRRTALQSV
jgi:iron-sulfur cluster repair protein YtfE (RIC family)